MSYEPWHETSHVHTRNHAQPLWHLSSLKASGTSNLFGAELPRIVREYEACIALIKPKEDNQQRLSPHHLLPLSDGVKSYAPKSSAEARFTGPIVFCYTTQRTQGSTCQHGLRSECCDG